MVSMDTRINYHISFIMERAKTYSKIYEIVRKAVDFLGRNMWFIMYRSYRRSEEDEKKTKNVWLKGHTGKYIHTLHPVTHYPDPTY